MARSGPTAAQPSRDALLQQARTLRARQALPQALGVLAQLEAAHPRFSRLFEERGHCLILLRDGAAAVRALETAVRLNPALPASWDMLEQLHRLRGDAAQAAKAAQNLAMLQRLPMAVVVAQSLLADDDPEPAEAAIRGHLRSDPANPGALRLLAQIRLASGDPVEAEALLAGVLDQMPDWHAARLDLAMALLQQQKPAQARAEAERLLAHDPHDRDYRKQFAAACVASGDHEPVIAIYADLLADPGLANPRLGAGEVADLRLWRANALKITGRTDEAVADYRAALAARSTNGAAWFGLANLKTFRFADDDIDAMQGLLKRSDLPAMDRVYLAFALGQAWENRGDAAVAWSWYARGNALRQRTSRYRPDRAEAGLARLQQAFTPAFRAERMGWGHSDPAPIFVVGLPRSGSTLVEQILASHPLVEGTQELTAIGQIASEICGCDPASGLPERPDALAALTAADCAALGRRYIDATRVHRREGKPFFIDKMPNNAWHVGLIHLILPQATIIDVRREPMACCFGNFKQLFGTTNQEFTYDLDGMARHYRAYLAMMRHWDAVLPGRVLRVHHEDIVADLHGQVERLLAYCRLAFAPECLAFHQTRRSVRTPSSEQVRRPIDPAALDRWRAFSPWLEPLEQALGDAVHTYRS